MTPTPTPATSLVAAYSFDEGSGTTVTDASGYGNTGTISGASWTSQGKFGNALSFDGISNWVTVNDSDSLDLASGMTLEAWAYPTTAPGTWTTILLKEAPPGNNLAYHLQGDPSNHPSSYITTDVSGLQGVVGPQALPLNTWTYLAATYNGAMLSVYVNGTVVVSQPVSGNIVPSVGPLRFGGNSIWGEYFAGKIDEVRIYNRALSQTEIQADMGTPVGTPTPSPTPTPTPTPSPTPTPTPTPSPTPTPTPTQTPTPSPAPTQVVSRKMHGGTPRDINLPLTGNSGIECRSGGATNDYEVVFTFASSVTFNSATVTGVGTVSDSSGNGTTTVTVNLTGVTNAQWITITLLGVNDGTSTGDVGVKMGVLVGDSNGDGFVNAGDTLQTRNRSGQVTDATNFRSDVNVDGFINIGDTLIVRSRSGTFLP
jgi:Concanavalin A-like lectin/glucanases superfamily/Dockerin type I domain